MTSPKPIAPARLAEVRDRLQMFKDCGIGRINPNSTEAMACDLIDEVDRLADDVGRLTASLRLARTNTEEWLASCGWEARPDGRHGLTHWHRGGVRVTTGDDAGLLCSALRAVASVSATEVTRLRSRVRVEASDVEAAIDAGLTEAHVGRWATAHGRTDYMFRGALQWPVEFADIVHGWSLALRRSGLDILDEMARMPVETTG